MVTKQKVEITLSLEPGPAKYFKNIREFIQDRIRRSSKGAILIAAEMDLSPSDLARKLAENKNDTRGFRTKDAEKYMETQYDWAPVLFWVEKYLLPRSNADIKKKIEELKLMLIEEEEK